MYVYMYIIAYVHIYIYIYIYIYICVRVYVHIYIYIYIFVGGRQRGPEVPRRHRPAARQRDAPRAAGQACPPYLYILQMGVQWNQGVVIYMTLYTSLLYSTTPIHCTPDPLHPPLQSIHYQIKQQTTNNNTT